MAAIISPIDRDLILAELTEDKLLRVTNNGNNVIYIIDAHNSPNTMQEIGRLREETFRLAGGGTGNEVDIDKYDISENPYKQLIVWNPEDNEIVGGYRFMHGADAGKDENGVCQFGTSGLFHLSEKFEHDFLPITIELGRSFVQPKFQPTKDSRKGIFSLDNLWDGLGALSVEYPEVKYFLGKVTMYPHYDRIARNLILYFMNKYFPDPDQLVRPIHPLITFTDADGYEDIFIAGNYADDYKILVAKVRERNTMIPPLVNAYMNLSSTMRCFGTSINPTFGEVEETGILINIEDIYEAKKLRYMSSYIKRR